MDFEFFLYMNNFGLFRARIATCGMTGFGGTSAGASIRNVRYLGSSLFVGSAIRLWKTDQWTKLIATTGVTEIAVL
jgi:hypothetical protein